MAEIKATITEVKQAHVLDGNYDQVEVHFDIIEGETVVASKVHGFPLSATEEDITEALRKEIATYQSDKVVGEQSAKTEELQANAAETAKQLSGKEIV